MKISLITTVDHNIGDDFVREGIKYLLRKRFVGEEIEFQNIHKHSPVTVRYGYEHIRKLLLSKIVDGILPINYSQDRISDADYVVQSGAPVYWCHDVGGTHCYKNEWYKPLIQERLLRQNKAKFLNLAAGECQKYHSEGTEFCEKCTQYIADLYEHSSVTILRDKLAKTVLRNAGKDAPVLACSSIFAVDEHRIEVGGSDYIAVNYMIGGAHYDFGQHIQVKKWEQEFKKLYFKIKETDKVIAVCHDEEEKRAILKIDPNAEIFYRKKDYLSYLKFYSNAKMGIVNRVHGAFALASFGKPSLVIGNDSRARMVEEIGLKSHFVNDVNCEFLYGELAKLAGSIDSYEVKMRTIKDKAYKSYMEMLLEI